ncbi:MAG: acyl-CoA dehydrogenase family protein [Steroidobacteraceae bacterium]
MDFSFTDEQELLADSVRHFLTDHYALEQRRRIIASPSGSSAAVWQGFADLGLLGLIAPDGQGGLGGGPIETLRVAGVMGEHLVVEPFLSSAIIATQALLDLGSPSQVQRLLPPMLSGERIAVLADAACTGDAARLAPVLATRTPSGFRLSGRIEVVYHAPLADHLLVSARTGEADVTNALFVVDRATAGVRLVPYASVDAQAVADVELDLEVHETARLGGDATGPLERVREAGRVALCAETLGVLDRALAITVEYTRTRQQFGGPIARFQVLQHRLVEMLMRIEQARSLVFLAASRLGSADAGARSAAVAAAKVLIDDAARFVGEEAVQLHGGMGVADESPISHYFKRLVATQIRFGSAATHLERYAETMDLSG